MFFIWNSSGLFVCQNPQLAEREKSDTLAWTQVLLESITLTPYDGGKMSQRQDVEPEWGAGFATLLCTDFSALIPPDWGILRSRPCVSLRNPLTSFVIVIGKTKEKLTISSHICKCKPL
jgi:hypothetical protein